MGCRKRRLGLWRGKMDKNYYAKIVYMDLPFLIDVEDNFRDLDLQDWAEAFLGHKPNLPYCRYSPRPDKPNKLTIASSIPVYLPNKNLAESYEINVDDKYKAKLMFLSRVNQNQEYLVVGKVIGDRYGKCSFSTVRVLFNLKHFKNVKHDDNTFFTNIAIRAVNIFIEHYRFVAQKPYINSISQIMLTNTFVIDYYDGGINPPLSLQIYNGPIDGFGKPRIAKEKDQLLRKVLMENKHLSTANTINLDILDKLDLKEWRLAAIESEVLFETWINNFLGNKFKKNGVDEKTINKFFHNNDKYNTPVTAYYMAKVLIKEATGYDFSKSKEFDNWSKYSKDLRNDIVHGKKYSITKDEAVKSYNSVIEAVELIEKETK